jgi:hypothetical protein
MPSVDTATWIGRWRGAAALGLAAGTATLLAAFLPLRGVVRQIGHLLLASGAFARVFLHPWMCPSPPDERVAEGCKDHSLRR